MEEKDNKLVYAKAEIEKLNKNIIVLNSSSKNRIEGKDGEIVKART